MMNRARGHLRWGTSSKFYEEVAREARPCRVCGSTIAAGETFVGQHWKIGSAHVACGWFTPNDVSTGTVAAFERGEPWNKNEWDCFTIDGVVVIDPRTGKRALSERGEKLFQQIQAAK